MRVTQESARDYLRRGLEVRGHGAGSDLAKALGLPESRISEMATGKRAIRLEEMFVIERFFNDDMPPFWPVSAGGKPISEADTAMLAAFKDLPAGMQKHYRDSIVSASKAMGKMAGSNAEGAPKGGEADTPHLSNC